MGWLIDPTLLTVSKRTDLHWLVSMLCRGLQTPRIVLLLATTSDLPKLVFCIEAKPMLFLHWWYSFSVSVWSPLSSEGPGLIGVESEGSQKGTGSWPLSRKLVGGHRDRYQRLCWSSRMMDESQWGSGGWESRPEGALKVWNTLGTTLPTSPGPAAWGYVHMEGLQVLSETETIRQQGCMGECLSVLMILWFRWYG